eukprot:gnl/Trimastix_PCT/3547.p1 GENE.gnl/Trimastix_PCT/3547~~gnl/Trimastix_PCT/3547.p1  ORF type:complete len:221 (-),score=43.52 gnl/Trimastix_PCT/3547:20-682(-)
MMRWRNFLSFISLSLLLLSIFPTYTHALEEGDEDEIEYDYSLVTCGSAIKLKHNPTGYYLHSHQVTYGSGSQQQSVTCFDKRDDPGSLWVVEGPHNQHCKRGEPIQCGTAVRLLHAATGRNLHSHHFRSPLSGQQEVSAFGEGGQGDSGDNWVVECSGSWKRGATVRFKHKATGRYLHSHAGHRFGHPIAGQQEVTGFTQRNSDNLWRTQEGVYVGRALE